MQSSVQLPLRFDPERLKADLVHVLPEEWITHFNTACYVGEWSGVSLRSVGGRSTIYPDPAASGSFQDTPVLERCSYFREVLDSLQCRKEAVRLLRLGAGARILEHTDYNLGFEDGEIRLHVPVVTDPAVEFYLEGERIDMKEGECWYLNFSRSHRVDNNSSVDRVHLIIDCTVNEWLAELIRNASVRGVPAG